MSYLSHSGANVPGSESSKERKFQGAKVPGSESSRERKFQGAKVPPMVLSLLGAKVRGNESSIIPVAQGRGEFLNCLKHRKLCLWLFCSVLVLQSGCGFAVGRFLQVGYERLDRYTRIRQLSGRSI